MEDVVVRKGLALRAKLVKSPGKPSTSIGARNEVTPVRTLHPGPQHMNFRARTRSVDATVPGTSMALHPHYTCSFSTVQSASSSYHFYYMEYLMSNSCFDIPLNLLHNNLWSSYHQFAYAIVHLDPNGIVASIHNHTAYSSLNNSPFHPPYFLHSILIRNLQLTPAFDQTANSLTVSTLKEQVVPSFCLCSHLY